MAHSIYYSNTVLLDAAKMEPVSASVMVSTEPMGFFGTKYKVPFVTGSDYELSFNLACVKSSSNFAGRMDVHLVGSAFPSKNPYGHLLASVTCSIGQSVRVFPRTSVLFPALQSGTAHLRFLIYGGVWYVSDVSLANAYDFGFHPDDVSFLIPVAGVQEENVVFKAELFDINYNLFPVTIESADTYFIGNTLFIRGANNIVSGTLFIASDTASGSILLTSTGYRMPDGTSRPGAAIFIGSGTYKSPDTPFLVGSSSMGTVVSIGDKFFASPDPSGTMSLTVSGGLAVFHTGSGRWMDVRDFIISHLP